MKLTNINMHTPKKLLFTTILATSLVAGASAMNTDSDSLKKQNTETVDKSYTDKFVSVIKNIDEYDTSVIENIQGNPKESFAKENKTLLRFFTGLLMSVIGSMVGTYRKENGYKDISNAEKCSNFGFAAGFLLPGITAAGTLTVSFSILADAIGKFLTKGNTIAGKISSAAAGIISVLKLFF